MDWHFLCILAAVVLRIEKGYSYGCFSSGNVESGNVHGQNEFTGSDIMNVALRCLGIGAILSLAACAGDIEQESHINLTPVTIGLDDRNLVSSGNSELTAGLRASLVSQVREVLQRGFDKNTFLLVQNNLENLRIEKIELTEVTRRSINGRTSLNNSNVSIVGEYHQYRAQFEVSVPSIEHGDLIFYYSIDNLYYYPNLTIKGEAGLTINPATFLANLSPLPDFVGAFLGRILNIEFKIGADGEYKVENFLFGEMLAEKGASSSQPTEFQIKVFQNVFQPLCQDMISRNTHSLSHDDCRPSYEFTRSDRIYVDIGRAIFLGPSLNDIKLYGHGWIINPADSIEEVADGWVFTGRLERYRFLNMGTDVIEYSFMIRKDGAIRELSYWSDNPTTSWHSSGRNIIENSMRAIEASGWLKPL